MGHLLFFAALTWSVAALVHRRRTHTTIVVPLVVGGLCIAHDLWTLYKLIHSFAAVAGVDPSLKATLLAKGISEALNVSTREALLLVALIPLAWFFDDLLRRRQSAARSATPLT